MVTDKRRNKLAHGVPVRARIQVPDSILSEATELYEKGRYVDAAHVALRAGPLQNWDGSEALVFGFRLANNVGAGRLGKLLISRARHQAPTDPQTTVHYGYHLLRQKGPMEVWRYAGESENLPTLLPSQRSDLLCMRAVIAAGYRDFDTAWRLFGEAVAGERLSAWLLTEKSSIHLHEESKLEALTCLDEALQMSPWFRPAVQQKARVLHLLGKREEAITFLTQSLDQVQSYALAAQLLVLKREADDHAGMAAWVDRVESMSMWQTPAEREWLQSVRADIFCLAGDYDRAADHAGKVTDSFYADLAIRLRQTGVKAGRIRLPLSFVHQNQNTCAPATLAAIVQYWKRPISMEQIVDAICYDGTYDYTERSWAEANGFATREFTITRESVRTLIGAGLPFAAHTVEVSSAHSQAVIGYDELRQTLFIQDPSEPSYREVEEAEFLESYQLNGPRGLVLVPKDQQAVLTGMQLPDSALYDLNHEFSNALASFDREKAALVLERMTLLAGRHSLILLARMALANFDGNEVERSIWIDQLLEMFPKDPRVLNWKILALRSLGSRKERLSLLRQAVALKECQAHPAFIRDLGLELLKGAQDWPEARRLLSKAHRCMPTDGAVLTGLGEALYRSSLQTSTQWLDYYRFAAAHSDKAEGLAQTWFNAAVSLGQSEVALEWLRRRMGTYGSKSSAPALTLAHALDALCRPEVLDVLREAVVLRPNDGELLIQLSKLEGLVGESAKAAELLNRAKGKCPPGQWLRAEAALLRRLGDHAAELKTWQDILLAEPLALDAHTVVANSLVSREGPHAARAHFETVCERFPRHYGVAQSFVGWLREEDPDRAAQELRRLVETHPENPWAHRELALIRREQHRFAEALEHAHAALRLAPYQAASHAILGLIQLSLASRPQAEDALHAAIARDVNYGAAYEALMQVDETSAGKRRALAFIRSEMIRQVLDGNGLHAYRNCAFTVLDPSELLVELREIWQARPDLWESWSVLIAQLLESGAVAEGLELARKSTDRFSLTPGAWWDLAKACRLANDSSGTIKAAWRAVHLNPDWPVGWCSLAEHLEDCGQSLEAADILRKVLVRLPSEFTVRRALALLLWRMNEREEAWKMAEKTAVEEPRQGWAWGSLLSWAIPLQRQEAVNDLGRRLTIQHPGEARYWLLLARLLPFALLDERLKCLDQVVAINPRLPDPYDLRAELLSYVGRVDEAEACLRSGPWEEKDLPFSLQGRLAWLQTVRGDTVAAMQQMRAVLDLHRDYQWGWEVYAGWAKECTNVAEWQRAAAEMLRLSPTDPLAYAEAADVEFHIENAPKALQHLRQALQIAPGSPYPAQRLLDWHWQKRDMDALATAAQLVSSTGTAGLVRDVYLMLEMAHRRHLLQLKEALRKLAVHPDPMGPLLNTIADYFLGRRDAAQILDEVLEETIKNATIGPAFATLWVKQQTDQGHWHCWVQLNTWIGRFGPRIEMAVCCYLDQIGAARAAVPHLNQWIASNEAGLRQIGEVWAKVGYALASSEAFQECVDWLGADYLRADAQGWALSNLVISFRALGQPDDAEEVALHVVQQGIRDSSWPIHVAIAACSYAKAGNYEEARSLLLQNPVANAGPQWHLLGLTAMAVADVMTAATPAESVKLFKEFLANTKYLVGRQEVTELIRWEHDRAIELMQQHTGFRPKRWHKPPPAGHMPGRMPGRTTYEGNIIVKAAIFLGIILVVNFVRSCPDSQQVRTRSVIKHADEVLERFDRMSKYPQILPPPAGSPVVPPPMLSPITGQPLLPQPKSTLDEILEKNANTSGEVLIGPR